MLKTNRTRNVLGAVPFLLAACGSNGSPAAETLGMSGSTSNSSSTARTLEGLGGALVLGGAATTLSASGGGSTRNGSQTRISSTSGGTVTAGGASASGGTQSRGGSPSGGAVTLGSSSAMSGGASAATSGGSNTTPRNDCDGSASRSYDQTILCDRPVAYWAMNETSGSEPDLTSNGNAGTYRGGPLTTTILPNGDPAVVFDGSSQYLTIASKELFSIPTTGDFVWEAWIKPSVLQFPNDGGSGYVDWMGKCADYSPTCEWEARMYSTTNAEGRCNRISAYVFNPSAGLGSAADWQPTCGLLEANEWYHVVGAYTTKSQPSICSNGTSYPGSIEIWVNGVRWSQSRHGQTGCMSQYSVVPKAGTSPVNIGTMAQDGWFPGSVAKVAFYGYLLTEAQVAKHFTTMTGKQPTGTCANDCSF